ncbi:MAG: 3-isopropylmalate dehydrogenase [Rhizobiales bacterium]|nr:3-isopropylmalate dehydrogenase [Hyphomicrobiales bacterium]
MDAKIVLLPGDGIGPEIIDATLPVIDAISSKYGHKIQTERVLIGGSAIDAHGVPLRPEDLDACRAADGVLLGAIGGPKWDNPNASVRPEQGLLALRRGMGLYANLRPVKVMKALAPSSPVKTEIVQDVDMIVVRELTGGLYFGKPRRKWRERRGRAALDTLIYREYEIARIVKLAFELAQGRKGKVASVDKANVIETSRLWRVVVGDLAKDYPTVAVENVLVDTMTMRLITGPSKFDVIVTENMFGDILTDEASVLAGSIGVLPSASIGAPRGKDDSRRRGLYEPIHGSAPDIAGQGKANPAGTILSFAMLLRMSLGLDDEANAVERAVEDAIGQGVRTPDIAAAGKAPATTAEFGTAVAKLIRF